MAEKLKSASGLHPYIKACEKLKKESMLGVYCCEKVRTARVFRLEPRDGYVFCEASYLKSCPVCSNAVLQLERYDAKGIRSVLRYKGSRAQRTFSSLRKSILFELENFVQKGEKGGFYLNYNEFGRKKRCYSNLSAMKSGLFENKNLPVKQLLS